MLSRKAWIAVSFAAFTAVITALIFLPPKPTPFTDAVHIRSSVQIAYIPVVQSLPLFIAVDKGYFAEKNIDVELVKLNSPTLLTNAVLSGDADLAFPAATGITAIAESQNPGKQKVFAMIGGDNTVDNDILIAAKDSDMDSIDDLRGKKLGTIPGIQFRTIAQHILAKNGLAIDTDVTVIELAPELQVQALASGQVDAVLSLEPIATIAEVKGLGKKLIESPMVEYVSDPWYGASAVMNSAFASEDQDLARDIIATLERAMSDIESNPNDAKRYLANYTPLDAALIEAVGLPTFKMTDDLAQEDLEAIDMFIDIFATYGVMQNELKFQDLFYDPS